MNDETLPRELTDDERRALLADIDRDWRYQRDLAERAYNQQLARLEWHYTEKRAKILAMPDAEKNNREPR